MTVKVIVVADPFNPVEFQQWLDGNPLAVISKIWSYENLFYVLY